MHSAAKKKSAFIFVFENETLSCQVQGKIMKLCWNTAVHNANAILTRRTKKCLKRFYNYTKLAWIRYCISWQCNSVEDLLKWLSSIEQSLAVHWSDLKHYVTLIYGDKRFEFHMPRFDIYYDKSSTSSISLTPRLKVREKCDAIYSPSPLKCEQRSRYSHWVHDKRYESRLN